MFQITENERKIFDFIISGRENLKTTIVRDGLTVEKFLKKDCLTSEEIQAIYKVLPQDVEFYKFVNILHLAKFSTSKPGPSEDYKARIERLKAEQANREYKEMVKSVDMTQKFDLNTGFGQVRKRILPFLFPIQSVA
uniref:Uncharacterized protein n=1 Tax=Acrobeloides nanus TaxID=290746 RepID=A0A914D9Z8_9BILA